MQHCWGLLCGLRYPSSTERHLDASSTGAPCCLPAHVNLSDHCTAAGFPCSELFVLCKSIMRLTWKTAFHEASHGIYG